MKFNSLFYFTTPKLVTLSDVRVGGLNKFFQTCILAFILYDLCFNELYLKTEIPSGYTTFWTEEGNLTNIQQNNISDFSYCNNNSYDYGAFFSLSLTVSFLVFCISFIYYRSSLNQMKN